MAGAEAERVAEARGSGDRAPGAPMRRGRLGTTPAPPERDDESHLDFVARGYVMGPLAESMKQQGEQALRAFQA